jgi:hypothetical protein
MRFHKVVNALNKVKPGAGDELKMRVTGGHFDLTGPARDFADGKSLADEFAGTSLERGANAATRSATRSPRRRSGTAGRSTRVPCSAPINGTLEQTARRAMAGQAIKNSPLIESHIIGLTDKAIQEAAHGLKGTENQVALGRAVDRMYGKYQKFSPERRSLLLHWTPFLPWYLNARRSSSRCSPSTIRCRRRCWRTSTRRRRTGASTTTCRCCRATTSRTSCSAPTRPARTSTCGSRTTRRSASAPTRPALSGRSRCRSSRPRGSTPLGVDWKGDPLTVGSSHGKKFNTGQKAIRALVTAAEEQVPGVTQAGAISGVTPRYVDKNTPSSIKSPGAGAPRATCRRPRRRAASPAAAPSSR